MSRYSAGIIWNEEGECRPALARRVSDGEPLLPGEVVGVPRGDGLYEVVDPHSKGPCKVATEDYRCGWDRIFGGRQEVGRA